MCCVQATQLSFEHLTCALVVDLFILYSFYKCVSYDIFHFIQKYNQSNLMIFVHEYFVSDFFYPEVVK